MQNGGRFCRTLILLVASMQSASIGWTDGGFFDGATEVSSADQRAIIVRIGDETCVTLSVGFTGEASDFVWIVPTPVMPDSVRETGALAEAAFTGLDGLTMPVATTSQGTCFPAGTEVLTAEGLRAIDTVEVGARVYACDESAGAWATARVLARQYLQFEGDLITIRFGSITVRATGNHPFRVLRGAQLDIRPPARDVPPEVRATGINGRWVEARDLVKGDVLMAKDGGVAEITGVSSTLAKAIVYNLEVEGYHTYAVGRTGILVHNKGAAEVQRLDAQATVLPPASLVRFEVSILGGPGLPSLDEWLVGNGYRVDPAAREILNSYARSGWVFAVVKLRPGEQRRYHNEFLPAITIRFRSDRLVYPVRLSSASVTGMVKVTLYVIAGSTVSSSNPPTRSLVFRAFIPEFLDARAYLEGSIRATAGDDGRNLVVMSKSVFGPGDALRNTLIELEGTPFPTGAVLQLTRLEARMTPAAMITDWGLQSDRQPVEFRVRVDKSGSMWGGEGRPVPAQVPGLAGATAVSAGDYHSVALMKDGTATAWGFRGTGPLGAGRWTEVPEMVTAPGLYSIGAIAAGDFHTLALDRDGTVWAWSGIPFGLHSDDALPLETPVRIPGFARVLGIAAGHAFSVALGDDGTVWIWGSNFRGQLGNGTYENGGVPIRVPGLSGVRAIAAGTYHTIALMTDGTVWSWGWNLDGQLGREAVDSSPIPAQVPGLSQAAAIAGGEYHTLALTADGRVWAWGSNRYGQLGDGSTTSRSKPVQVPGVSGVVAIAAGSFHSIALKADGTVLSWGMNNWGQLGDGTDTIRYLPVQVVGLSGVRAIAAGLCHTVACRRDGTVWTWGWNRDGQLGTARTAP
jgi:alpha-tubulin suppressor-like RCC1 family protein